jgi:hypothetical protein
LPLSEKATIEVYLPDIPRPPYHDLLAALEKELTYTFGGSTIVRGLEGKMADPSALRLLPSHKAAPRQGDHAGEKAHEGRGVYDEFHAK